MKKQLLILLFLALVGCASVIPFGWTSGSSEGDSIKGSGTPAPAPWGYTDMCRREPNNPLCGGKHT